MMCNIQHSDSEGGSFDTRESVPIPSKIQIVDQETQTGVKPHTLYVILTWWEGDGEEGSPSSTTVCPLFSLPCRWKVKDSKTVNIPTSGREASLLLSLHSLFQEIQRV